MGLGRIQLATKCNQRPEVLEKYLGLAASLGVSAVEIQEVYSIMCEVPLQKRVEKAAAVMKGKVEGLVFHQPLWGAINSWEQTVKVLKFDLASEERDFALGLARETIMEAVDLGLQLGLEHPVLVNFHIMGFVQTKNICLKRKIDHLRRGEHSLLQLKRFTEDYCHGVGFTKNGKPQAVIVHENSYIFHPGDACALLSIHPLEITRLVGVGVNIDFAHLQLAMNYLNANPDCASALLEKQLYPPLTWEGTVETVKEQLELLHLNDAKGWTPEDEGIEIGLGEIPYKKLIPLICEKIKHDIIGTIEIKTQHIHPEEFINSVLQLKKQFGSKFDEYFF